MEKMHESIKYNTYYKTFEDFKQKIVGYLDKFSSGGYKEYYDWYLKDNFRVIHSPLLV